VTQALAAYIDRWNAWTNSSVNRRILNASLIVGIFTFLVYVAKAAKEPVVAYRFGTGDALDAFLIAFLVPSFAISIVAGSFPPAVIPVYLAVQERQGHAEAERVYAGIMGWSLVLLLGVTVLLTFIAPIILPLLALGFEENKLILTRSLYFMLLPMVILKGLAVMWTARLNISESFAIASITPVVTPLFTVIALLYTSSQFGIYALIVGTVGGAALETLIIGYYFHRLGMLTIPRWDRTTPAIKEVMKHYGFVAGGTTLMASATFVSQAMAAMLGPGSVSILSYSSKLVSFALEIGTTALGTAVLPHFSRMVVAEDWDGVRHTLRTYIQLILVTTIPLTLLALMISEPLVAIFFQRGAFTEGDTQAVGQVQALLFLQIPSYLAGIVIVRLLSALKANSILMWGCALNFIVNLGCNFLLMQWLHVAGIALATSIMYAISLAFLSWMLFHLLNAVSISKRS
jgi:putative peptidoglycan lipid II flippase